MKSVFTFNVDVGGVVYVGDFGELFVCGDIFEG
jgi:hypothetical protein